MNFREYSNKEEHMEYPYRDTEGEFGEMKSRDGGVWNYLPNDISCSAGEDKEVFGDVTGAAGYTNLRHISMQQEGKRKTMGLFRYKQKLSFFEKVLGYIPVSSPNGKAGYARLRVRSAKKILAVLILLLAFAAGVTAAFLGNRGPDLDDNAIAYQLPDGVKNTDPDTILLPGFDVLEMNYAAQEVEAALLNPEGNECFFKFTITLKSDGTELYHTGLIKPGTAVTKFKINKKLEKGRYPIVITVETSDLKDPESFYNGGAVEAVLEVG